MIKLSQIKDFPFSLEVELKEAHNNMWLAIWNFWFLFSEVNYQLSYHSAFWQTVRTTTMNNCGSISLITIAKEITTLAYIFSSRS